MSNANAAKWMHAIVAALSCAPLSISSREKLMRICKLIILAPGDSSCAYISTGRIMRKVFWDSDWLPWKLIALLRFSPRTRPWGSNIFLHFTGIHFKKLNHKNNIFSLTHSLHPIQDYYRVNIGYRLQKCVLWKESYRRWLKGSMTHFSALQISIKFLLQVSSDIRRILWTFKNSTPSS